jgi:hypothetical protein
MENENTQDKSNDTPEYEVTIGLEKVGTYSSLKDAIRCFVTEVQNMVEKGGCSWQVLETACWIVRTKPSGHLPLSFAQIKDLAYDLGVVDDNGKLT